MSISLPFKVTVSVTRMLVQGQKVEFAVEKGLKGPQATDVTVLSWIEKEPDAKASGSFDSL